MNETRPLNYTMDAGKQPTVCLDFDGVIHDYSDGWLGPVPTGGILPGAADAMREIKRAGIRLEIFSTRPKDNIVAFLKNHAIEDLVDEVRDGKPYYIAFFDDRAYHVEPNRGNGLSAAVLRWMGGIQ